VRAGAPARPTAEPIRLSPAALYARDRESVIVPLPFLALPRELQLLELGWHRKAEFHVTVAHTPAIAERIAPILGVDETTAADRAWRAITAAIRGAGIGEITLREEFFRIEREGERTLIAMCDVEGLDDLYRRLEEGLRVAVEPPPTHVTLYTSEPGGGGIGIHSREQLERDRAPLPPAELGNLSEAVSKALARP